MDKLSFLAIILREMKKLREQKGFFVFILVGPLLLSLLLVGIFWNGVMLSIPIAIFDADDNNYSREFQSMIDASPYLEITHMVNSQEEGIELIKKGTVNGMLIIPEHFAKDIMSGAQTTVVGFYNNQFMTQGGTINKAFTEVVATYAAQKDVERYIAKGITMDKIMGLVMPIEVNNHLLYNPSLNYSWFLLLGILPALWQLFGIGTIVLMIGLEINGRSQRIRHFAKTNTLSTFFAKMVPYFVIYCLHFSIILFLLFVVLKVPMNGSFVVITFSTILFIIATMAVGALIICVIKIISIGMSMASVYVAPAFAYAGATFPHEAMPTLAKFWSEMLPITHYHKILVDIAIRNAPISSAFSSLFSLALFSIIAFPIAILLFKVRLASNEE